MVFRSYYLGCLAHASYLVGDTETGTAAVIDPQRDVDPYLADAAADGLEIRHVFETHFHADFLSGHLELQARAGATIYYGADAAAEFEFMPLHDGDIVDMGRVRFQALATPGHTLEGISILVYDLDESAVTPHGVFTGDTLFIGDVGRPDLMAAAGTSAEELASLLFDSLHRKLLVLPDATRVYPAHGAGSLCGRALSDERVSTIGRERQQNYACAPMSRERFIRLATNELPAVPAYFSFDAQRNRELRPILEEVLAGLRPLSLAEVEELAAGGATLLDVREPAQFSALHVRGSLNIGLDGQYAMWAGSLIDRSRPIVIIAGPGRAREAALRLGRIGFDGVAGYLEAGLGALRAEDAMIGSLNRMTPPEVARRAPRPQVLDVRERSERQAAAIPDSRWIPLGQIKDRLGELPRDREVVVHCASGYRSIMAASLLIRSGFTRVVDLIGGIEGWSSAGLPVALGSPIAARSEVH